MEDAELDFCSSFFNPLKALNTVDLQPPFPEVRIFNNINEYARSIKSCKPDASQRNPGQNGAGLNVNDGEGSTGGLAQRLKNIANNKLRSRNRDPSRLAHLMKVKSKTDGIEEKVAMLEKTKRRPQQKNVLQRMEDQYKEGPLSILYNCVEQKKQLRVWTRRLKGLRGVCVGYLIAFDKHMNLAMMDVDEMFSIWEEVEVDPRALAERKERRKDKKRTWRRRKRRQVREENELRKKEDNANRHTAENVPGSDCWENEDHGTKSVLGRDKQDFQFSFTMDKTVCKSDKDIGVCEVNEEAPCLSDSTAKDEMELSYNDSHRSDLTTESLMDNEGPQGSGCPLEDDTDYKGDSGGDEEIWLELQKQSLCGNEDEKEMGDIKEKDEMTELSVKEEVKITASYQLRLQDGTNFDCEDEMSTSGTQKNAEVCKQLRMTCIVDGGELRNADRRRMDFQGEIIPRIREEDVRDLNEEQGSQIDCEKTLEMEKERCCSSESDITTYDAEGNVQEYCDLKKVLKETESGEEERLENLDDGDGDGDSKKAMEIFENEEVESGVLSRNSREMNETASDKEGGLKADENKYDDRRHKMDTCDIEYGEVQKNFNEEFVCTGTEKEASRNEGHGDCCNEDDKGKSEIDDVQVEVADLKEEVNDPESDTESLGSGDESRGKSEDEVDTWDIGDVRGQSDLKGEPKNSVSENEGIMTMKGVYHDGDDKPQVLHDKYDIPRNNEAKQDLEKDNVRNIEESSKIKEDQCVRKKTAEAGRDEAALRENPEEKELVTRGDGEDMLRIEEQSRGDKDDARLGVQVNEVFKDSNNEGIEGVVRHLNEIGTTVWESSSCKGEGEMVPSEAKKSIDAKDSFKKGEQENQFGHEDNDFDIGIHNVNENCKKLKASSEMKAKKAEMSSDRSEAGENVDIGKQSSKTDKNFSLVEENVPGVTTTALAECSDVVKHIEAEKDKTKKEVEEKIKKEEEEEEKEEGELTSSEDERCVSFLQEICVEQKGQSKNNEKESKNSLKDQEEAEMNDKKSVKGGISQERSERRSKGPGHSAKDKENKSGVKRDAGREKSTSGRGDKGVGKRRHERRESSSRVKVRDRSETEKRERSGNKREGDEGRRERDRDRKDTEAKKNGPESRKALRKETSRVIVSSKEKENLSKKQHPGDQRSCKDKKSKDSRSNEKLKPKIQHKHEFKSDSAASKTEKSRNESDKNTKTMDNRTRRKSQQKNTEKSIKQDSTCRGKERVLKKQDDCGRRRESGCGKSESESLLKKSDERLHCTPSNSDSGSRKTSKSRSDQRESKSSRSSSKYDKLDDHSKSKPRELNVTEAKKGGSGFCTGRKEVLPQGQGSEGLKEQSVSRKRDHEESSGAECGAKQRSSCDLKSKREENKNGRVKRSNSSNKTKVNDNSENERVEKYDEGELKKESNKNSSRVVGRNSEQDGSSKEERRNNDKEKAKIDGTLGRSGEEPRASSSKSQIPSEKHTVKSTSSSMVEESRLKRSQSDLNGRNNDRSKEKKEGSLRRRSREERRAPALKSGMTRGKQTVKSGPSFYLSDREEDEKKKPSERRKSPDILCRQEIDSLEKKGSSGKKDKSECEENRRIEIGKKERPRSGNENYRKESRRIERVVKEVFQWKGGCSRKEGKPSKRSDEEEKERCRKKMGDPDSSARRTKEHSEAKRGYDQSISKDKRMKNQNDKLARSKIETHEVPAKPKDLNKETEKRTSDNGGFSKTHRKGARETSGSRKGGYEKKENDETTDSRKDSNLKHSKGESVNVLGKANQGKSTKEKQSENVSKIRKSKSTTNKTNKDVEIKVTGKEKGIVKKSRDLDKDEKVPRFEKPGKVKESQSVVKRFGKRAREDDSTERPRKIKKLEGLKKHQNSPVKTKEAKLPGSVVSVRVLKVEREKALVLKRRHVNQVFIRGDNVIMVAYENVVSEKNKV